MKRALWLAAALAAASLPAGAAAQTVVIGVNGNSTGLRFTRVSVPLFADMTGAGGAKLGSYTARITWNYHILAYQGLDDQDPAVFAGATVRTDSASVGVLYVGGINAAGRSGVFDLVHLDFFVDSLNSSAINVQVLEASAAGTLANLLPSVVTVNGTFCPGDGRWGDLDGDNFANSRDALAILSSVVGLAVDTIQFKLRRGDVDGDTKIDSRDALIVLSYGVGLPIVGQRILLVASTSCSTGAPPSLTILPDTVDVVPRQTVQLLLTGVGAGGRPVALNGASWQVADGRMAIIDQGGELTAVDTGVTTVLVSIGPGVTASAPLIVRSHRAVWQVDPHVSQATVQLGNARFPFETPEYAFDLISEGDTIRIHPGTVPYLFSGSPTMKAGAVVIGDTLNDGTRPILRGTLGFDQDAFFWEGGKQATVRNIDFRSFARAIRNQGVNNLTVSNVRVETTNGAGIRSLQALDTLRVTNSTFTGDSSSGSGDGITVEGALRVVLHNIQVTGWFEDGVLLDAADTLDMLQANVSGNGKLGLHMIDQTGAGQAAVSHSRFVNNGRRNLPGQGDQISIAHARTVLFDHNYIQSLNDLAVFLEHPGVVAGSTFRSMKDSIRDRSFGEDQDWIFTNLDSVFVDSLWVENPRDTVLSSGGQFDSRFVQIKNSKFLNLWRQAFASTGNKLVVDSSMFTGCGVVGVCNWTTASAIHLANGLDPSLGEGPGGASKGSALVTNSSFFAIGSAFEGGGSLVGPVVFSRNAVDSVQFPVSLTLDTVTANDNVITRVKGNAIELVPANASSSTHGFVTVLRNQIGCVRPDAAGIVVTDQPATISGNHVDHCFVSIQATAAGAVTLGVLMARDTLFPYDSVLSSGFWLSGNINPTLLQNRIVGGGTGMYSETGGGATIDSNSISATRLAGIWMNGMPGPAVGRWNNISGNLLNGITVNSSTIAPQFYFGRFVGNHAFAINSLGVAVDAQHNYWGAATGPGGPLGVGHVADSVNYPAVNTTNFLTADPFPGSVPALVPRFFPTASAALSQAAQSPRPAAPVTASSPPAKRAALAQAPADAAAAATRTARNAARVARDEAIHQALRAKAASLPPPRRQR